MLLVIDIGNTNIVLGIFRRERLLAQWRISTQYHRTADEFGSLLLDLLVPHRLRAREVRGVILSSVVPPLTSVFREVSESYFSASPIIVSHALKTGLILQIDQPHELGADRIVNAAAGFRLFGGPLVIVDFGTATTFCAVGRGGEYLGGSIAPGLLISAEALCSRAAKLPKVELIPPPSSIGRDTVSAIQSGLIYGYAGLVDALVGRIRSEMGRPSVIATGGLSSLIAPHCRSIEKIHPTLTLEGLRIIYELNGPKATAKRGAKELPKGGR